MADPRVGDTIRPGFPGQGGNSPRGDGLPPSATGPTITGRTLPGPLLLRHGDPRTARASPRAVGGGPGMVVRRLHRTPRWQRPCQHQDPSRSAGLQLRPDRPEGLRRMGPTLGLVPPAGPYRERGYRTRRAHLVPAGHVDARPLPKPRRVHHGPGLR